MHGLKVVLLGMALVAPLFWFADSPSTVRAKVAILKLLPLDDDDLNQRIQLLCAGAHSGTNAVLSCFSSFYSSEAARAGLARDQCTAFARKVAHHRDWRRMDPVFEHQKPSFVYFGNEKSIREKSGDVVTFTESECGFTVYRDGTFFLRRF